MKIVVYAYIQARHEIKLVAKIMVRSYIKVTEQHRWFKSEVE